MHLKTDEEIKIMQKAGEISVEALYSVVEAVKPGITTLELDKIADDTIKKLGAKASFKTVDDYKYATCININEGIVHGLPNHTKIKQGDLVSIDLGAFLDGFHSDLSYSMEVGTKKYERFLNTGKKALNAAIEECKIGNHIGDIGNSIQKIVESAGYTVSRELVGHGIGKELHEDPYVPGYGRKNSGQLLKKGAVLAIEVIYQIGKPALVLAEDDWTIETLDKSISGLFESTVAVTTDGPLVLTPLDWDKLP